jgi:hypothetical protein
MRRGNVTYVEANKKNEQEPTLSCKACGFRQTVRLPLPVDQMCDIVEGFQRRHAECRRTNPEQ